MDEPRLNALFLKQDGVLSQHLNCSEWLRNAFGLVSDATYLGAKIVTEMRFQENKQDAIASLAIASFSPIVVATRVALWGDLPESLAVLRSGLESCAQLLFLVRNGNYQTAAYEMDRKFERFGFEQACAGLGGLGERLRGLHGLISEAASHSTPARLKSNSYDHEGQTFFRVGFARDAGKAELSVSYCMDVSLMVLDALRQAHEQDGLTFKYATEMNRLTGTYGPLNREFLSRFGNAPKND